MAGPGRIDGSPRALFSKVRLGLTNLVDLAPGLKTFGGDFGGDLPNGFVKTIGQGRVRTIVADPANPFYTVQDDDLVLLIDCSASALQITLPTIQTDGSRVLLFKMLNGTNACTIVPADGNTILTGSSIVLDVTDDGVLTFSNDSSQWVYFENPTPGTIGDVFGPASATDKAITRFNGTTGKIIQDSLVIVDDSGNLYPVVDDTQFLGSASSMWSHMYVHAIVSNSDLQLQSSAGDAVLKSVGGDLRFFAGISERHYDATNTEVFSIINDGLHTFVEMTGIPFIFADIAAAYTPGAHLVSVYKPTGVDNVLYARGDDGIDHLLTLNVDTSGAYLADLDMNSHNIVNVMDPTNPQDAATKSYVDGVSGGITALTGDGTATGPGSAALTLATVNSDVGTFGDATNVPQFTVNAKGLITAVTLVPISGGSPSGPAGGDLSGTYPNPGVAKINGVTLGTVTATSGNLLIGSGTAWVSQTMSGDGTINSTGVLTLATVNSNVGTFGSSTKTVTVTVNGKGLITAISEQTIGTLNQNTTGSAASLSISGQTGLLTFTGLTSTNRTKTVRDAADTILELGGSYTPTGTWTSLTMVTPILGTPTSGTLTNCTDLPEAGLSLSDNTTNDVSTTKHGFMPKLGAKPAAMPRYKYQRWFGYSGNSTAVTGIGQNDATVSATTTANGNDSDGPGVTISTSGGSGNTASIEPASFNRVQRQNGTIYFYAKLKLSQTINTRQWIGLSSATTTEGSGTDPLPNIHGIGFYFNPASGVSATNWLAVSNGGSASSSILDTGVAASTSVVTLECTLDTSGNMTWSVNGSQTNSGSTQPPSSTQDLGGSCKIGASSAAVKSVNFKCLEFFFSP